MPASARRPFLSPRLQLLAIGLAGCAALLFARGWYAHDLKFRFLAWNLALALVPAFAAAAMLHADRRGARVATVAWGAMWLLFLPNAPYLITDLVHLMPRPPVPYWFDIAVFATFAGAGMLAAFSSLQDVQHVVRRRFGRVASWTVVTLAAFAAGFGIELGRMQRWNSWDLLTQPTDLLAVVGGRLFEPWMHPRAMVVTFVYGAVLLFGYVAVRVILKPRPQDETQG
jgi:uncharacterized membrane protein